jgi:hypothetical protein|tara:strand:- start:95 stop:316 length:222 start_codon:yes stop_codon:yes gene_type:complete
MHDELSGLSARVRVLEGKMSDIESGVAVIGTEFVNLKEDLKDIKDGISWVIKLIIGAVLLAIIGAVWSSGGVL